VRLLQPFTPLYLGTGFYSTDQRVPACTAQPPVPAE
jgi:hypothetical protein